MGATESVPGQDDHEGSFMRDPSVRQLRVLCLHGRGSNNDITALQVVHLRLGEHGAACDMLEAEDEDTPSDMTLTLFTRRPFRTWFNTLWFFGGAYSVGQRGGSLHGALCRVMHFVEEFGPYDGIYGFSQGAFLASVLSNETCWRGLFGKSRCPWRFCIFANAGLTDRLMHTTLAQADDNSGSSALVFPSSLPTFHLYGAHDVFLAESREHATLYDGAVSYDLRASQSRGQTCAPFLLLNSGCSALLLRCEPHVHLPTSFADTATTLGTRSPNGSSWTTRSARR